VQTINLSPPQIASTVSKERKNNQISVYLAGGVDGTEVAQNSGVLLEGVDDGGLAGPPGNEVLERAQLPRLLHRVREFCKSNRNRGEAGQAAAPPLAYGKRGEAALGHVGDLRMRVKEDASEPSSGFLPVMVDLILSNQPKDERCGVEAMPREGERMCIAG